MFATRLALDLRTLPVIPIIQEHVGKLLNQSSTRGEDHRSPRSSLFPMEIHASTRTTCWTHARGLKVPRQGSISLLQSCQWINKYYSSFQVDFSLWDVYTCLGKPAAQHLENLKPSEVSFASVWRELPVVWEAGLSSGSVSPFIRMSTQNHFWTFVVVAPQFFSQKPSRP